MQYASMRPLRSLHSFGFEHYCNGVILIPDVTSARAFCKDYQDTNYCILGDGSNTAFVEDFDGVVAVIKIKGIEVSELVDGYRIQVGAGENWAELVQWTVSKGMPGLENLAAIPGTVGAAPIQNIGAYGAEVADFIESVTALDVQTGDVTTLLNDECQFAYRDSVFKQQTRGQYIILGVTFFLNKTWVPNLGYGDLGTLLSPSPSPTSIMQHVTKIRSAKLPDIATWGNAGSFFKNPYVSLEKLQTLKRSWPDLPSYPVDGTCAKLPAGWLIDRTGYKGQEHNGIQVYPKQALVLTNTGSGRGEDLLAFAREIRTSVYETFGVWLVNEVRLIGRNGEVEL